MNRKNFIKAASATVCATLVGCNTQAQKPVEQTEEMALLKSATFRKKKAKLFIDGHTKNFKALLITDAHIVLEDERGKPFYEYAKRMGGDEAKPENYGKTNGRDNNLRESLEMAKKEGVEIVLLAGDIVNYPSLAAIELLHKILNEAGLPWLYIAGNHDWHYEGEAGASFDLRQKWVYKNLLPLYQGHNPLYYAKAINGVNFVMMDDSTNTITKEQLAFFEQEIKKGLPTVLVMHIPLFLPGQNIDYGCGNKNWNAESDYLYKIERREPWPAKGHDQTTYDFHELAFSAPNVVAILAGHTHEEAFDTHRQTVQLVAGGNLQKEDILIEFI